MKTLHWSSAIQESAVSEAVPGVKEFVVSGIAINETTTRNKHKFVAEELQKSARSLIGKPLMKDHKTDSVDNIIGVVKDAFYDANAKGIKYKANVMEEKYQKMVQDGRIKNVSVGALAEELQPVEESAGTYLVKGIVFTELSFVPVPGDENASVGMDLANNFANCIFESFKDQIREKGEKNMEEKTNAEVEALKTQVQALKEALLSSTVKEDAESDVSRTNPSELKKTFTNFEDCVSKMGMTFCQKFYDVAKNGAGDKGEYNKDGSYSKPASIGKNTSPRPRAETQSADVAKIKEELRKEIMTELNEKGVVSPAQNNKVEEDVLVVGNHKVVREKNGTFTVVKVGAGGYITRAKDELELQALLKG